MRILVTGGAGFIASHIVDAFIASGHTVGVIDNLSSGKRENINPNATFFEIDITDRTKLEEVFKSFRPDIINHHAAQINVRRSVEDPIFDATVNIIGSLNLLELSKEYGVKRFIFASTGGAIYGDVGGIADESTPTAPISPYGASKRSVEIYLGYYHSVFGLDYVALRYANVYGPRQDPFGEAGVVAIFSERILSDKPCIVYGDGEQTRDYVYVMDVVEANIKALSSPVGIYNIGTGKETSVNELIEVLKIVSGRNFSVVYDAPRPGEVRRIALNCEKANKLLNWTPKTSIIDGIRETFNYFANMNN
ncbi:MAG: NAD-dependent epimerase/dehydratase family protein [bacterium]|nr:NAD-dependent epimerase/dehydratase family protein [bacterium]